MKRFLLAEDGYRDGLLGSRPSCDEALYLRWWQKGRDRARTIATPAEFAEELEILHS